MCYVVVDCGSDKQFVNNLLTEGTAHVWGGRIQCRSDIAAGYVIMRAYWLAGWLACLLAGLLAGWLAWCVRKLGRSVL